MDNTLPDTSPPSGGLILIWVPGVGLKWFHLGVGVGGGPVTPPPTVGGGPVTPPPTVAPPIQPTPEPKA